MKIKICGIRNIESAEAAVNAGADFIGFNFVPTSKRKIEPVVAGEILNQLPEDLALKVIGVFKDQTLDDIKKVLAVVPLDYVQLHGSETPEFCASLKFPIVKALGVEYDFNPQDVLSVMNTYSSVELFLLDRAVQGQGNRLNINSITELAKYAKFLLAGGITLDNVKEYLKIPGLYGIDIAGGVETDGRPDLAKIQKITSLVKG